MQVKKPANYHPALPLIQHQCPEHCRPEHLAFSFCNRLELISSGSHACRPSVSARRQVRERHCGALLLPKPSVPVADKAVASSEWAIERILLVQGEAYGKYLFAG